MTHAGLMKRSAILVLAVLSWACGDAASSWPTGDGGSSATAAATALAAAMAARRPRAAAVAAAAAGAATSAGHDPVFVAQGSMGRTIISCDDGQTWVADHAWDNDGNDLLCGDPTPVRCWDSNCSYLQNGQCVDAQCCNDTADESKGVAYGDGRFAATWGWGMPGALGAHRRRRRLDASHPAVRSAASPTASGASSPRRASRCGRPTAVDWQPTDPADFQNAERPGPVERAQLRVRRLPGRRPLRRGRDRRRGHDILVSSDGQSWWRPSVIPDECGTDTFFYGSILGGNDVFVIVGQPGTVCRSTDGGDTWAMGRPGCPRSSRTGVWTGSEFQYWGEDSVMTTSTDGLDWTHTPMTTPMRIGPVARSDDGTYVAIDSVWSGYEQPAILALDRRTGVGARGGQRPGPSHLPHRVRLRRSEHDLPGAVSPHPLVTPCLLRSLPR